MNQDYDNHQSGYANPPDNSLSQMIPSSHYSRFQDSSSALISPHHVQLHSSSFHSVSSSPGLESSFVEEQSHGTLANVSEHANIDHNNSIYYPQSDPARSPEYFSFSLGQDLQAGHLEMLEDKQEGPTEVPLFASTQGFGGHRSGTTIRYDSLPCTSDASLLVEDEEIDYHQGCSSSESIESFLRSPSCLDPFSSPVRELIHETNAIPQAKKKRNKCTPEQSRQLEAFFARNRNPTGRIREELSKRIQMPERSVQVWFQNKRAKTKINEIKDGVPLDQRTTVSRTKMTRAVSANDVTTTKKRKAAPEPLLIEDSLIPLPSSSLCIGEWRRIKPLICLFSRRNQSFTWYLSSESVGFKLECPLSCVTRITFSGPTDPTVHEFSEGVNQPLGQLSLELSRPPQFYMEVFRSSAKATDVDGTTHKASWRQCTDFTEGRQATATLRHVVSGPYTLLHHAVKQLYESSAVVSSLLELLPEEETPQRSSTSSDSHKNQNWHDACQFDSHLFSPTTNLSFAEMQGRFSQVAPSSSWSSAYPEESVSLPQEMPVSASAQLDFTSLRLQTPSHEVVSFEQLRRQSSGDINPLNWMNPPHQSHSHSHSQSQQSQYNYRQQQQQQQHLPLPLSASWNLNDSTMDNHNVSLFETASAPAYEVRSFAEQQRVPPETRHRSFGDIHADPAKLESGF